MKNLAANPRYHRASSGTNVMRRNLAAYPLGIAVNAPAGAAGVFTGRWAGSTGGVAAHSIVTGATDGPDGITQYFRKVWSASPIINADTGVNLSNATGNTGTHVGGFPVDPSLTYTVSAYVRATAKNKIGGGIQVWFRDVDGNYITASAKSSPNVAMPEGEWMRGSLTFTPPPTAVTVGMVLDVDGGDVWLPGEILDVTGVLVEALPALLPYFDGSTVDDTGVLYEWEGAANASPSTAKSAAVEVRRNIAPFPRMGAGATISAWTPGGTSEQSDLTGISGPLGIATAKRTTILTTATGLGEPIQTNASGFTSGKQVCGSAYVRVSHGGNYQIALHFLASGSTTITTKFGPMVELPANEWVRVSTGVTTVPEGTSYVRLAIRTAASTLPQAGRTYDMTGVLLEEYPALGNYFDGWLTPDADLCPAWTGAAGGSPSILRGVAANGVALSAAYGGRVIRSWLGGVRLISHTAAPTSESMFIGVGGFSSASVMLPGRTYTAFAQLRIDAPFPEVGPSGLRVGIRTGGGTTATTLAMSPPAPNEAGVHIVRVTTTIDAGAGYSLVQCNQYIAAGGGEAVWEWVAVVEGVYNGPFFDGDTVDASWDGAPHASTSEKPLPALSVWDAEKGEERWIGLYLNPLP